MPPRHRKRQRPRGPKLHISFPMSPKAQNRLPSPLSSFRKTMAIEMARAFPQRGEWDTLRESATSTRTKSILSSRRGDQSATEIRLWFFASMEPVRVYGSHISWGELYFQKPRSGWNSFYIVLQNRYCWTILRKRRFRYEFPCANGRLPGFTPAGNTRQNKA